jgi:hypothetical protein
MAKIGIKHEDIWSVVTTYVHWRFLALVYGGFQVTGNMTENPGKNPHIILN